MKPEQQIKALAELDGFCCNLEFKQADGRLPSIGEQVLKVQVSSVELPYWIDARKEAGTLVILSDDN